MSRGTYPNSHQQLPTAFRQRARESERKTHKLPQPRQRRQPRRRRIAHLIHAIQRQHQPLPILPLLQKALQPRHKRTQILTSWPRRRHRRLSPRRHSHLHTPQRALQQLAHGDALGGGDEDVRARGAGVEQRAQEGGFAGCGGAVEDDCAGGGRGRRGGGEE